MTEFDQGLNAVEDEKLLYNSLEAQTEEKNKNKVVKGVVYSLILTCIIIMAVTIFNLLADEKQPGDTTCNNPMCWLY